MLIQTHLTFSTAAARRSLETNELSLLINSTETQHPPSCQTVRSGIPVSSGGKQATFLILPSARRINFEEVRMRRDAPDSPIGCLLPRQRKLLRCGHDWVRTGRRAAHRGTGPVGGAGASQAVESQPVVLRVSNETTRAEQFRKSITGWSSAWSSS